MPLLQPLRGSVSGLRLKRALIILLVVAIHALLLSLWWHAVYRPLPNQSSEKVAHVDRSPTIVFLLGPDVPAAIKLLRDEPLLGARATRSDRMHDAVSGPVYGSRDSNVAASANTVAPAIHEDSVLPAPSAEPSQLGMASAPAQSASAPLNLGDDVIRSAATKSQGPGRKLVEITGQQVNKLKLTQNEQLAATIAAASIPDCVKFLKFDAPSIESEAATHQLLAPTRDPSSGREVTIPINPAAALLYAAATGKCKF